MIRNALVNPNFYWKCFSEINHLRESNYSMRTALLQETQFHVLQYARGQTNPKSWKGAEYFLNFGFEIKILSPFQCTFKILHSLEWQEKSPPALFWPLLFYLLKGSTFFRICSGPEEWEVEGLSRISKNSNSCSALLNPYFCLCKINCPAGNPGATVGSFWIVFTEMGLLWGIVIPYYTFF